MEGEGREDPLAYVEEGIPEISLHAMAGLQAPQTMRLKASIQKTGVTLLVDTRSTHNFLNTDLAKKVGLTPEKNTTFTVVVANGEKINSKGQCRKVQVWIQGTLFTLEFYLLPLVGYDVVVGVQWLRTLGLIMWDFSKLHMSFRYKDKWVQLRGIASPKDRMVEAQPMLKAIKKQQGGIIIRLFSVQLGVEQDFLTTKNSSLRKLLEEYNQIFEEPHGLPPNRVQDHKIPLQHGTGAVNVRPYRNPHYQKNEIEKIVMGLLSSGMIRPSNSPYSSPVLLVKKHDGSWRLCVDYRALNRITIKDKFPIPVVDELLDELHGSLYFSKLDLRSGYHQIKMHEGDVEKTTFRTHHGHFEFLVMPFGLTNAPSTFQSLMNEIFNKVTCKFVLVFFDDILIYSKTWDEHLQHLLIVFKILRANRLYVRREKCSFAQEEVIYLGHIIGRQGVRMDPEKVSAMRDWPIPRSIKALRGFLGLTGYYRKFIHQYGSIARALTQLLKKDSFQWCIEAEVAFLQLKEAMTQAPVLALPDFSKKIIIECDASGVGIGAVLMQEKQPIAYFSKALHGRNLNLSTYEKEMLALVAAVQKW
jgi:hypothetical protein